MKKIMKSILNGISNYYLFRAKLSYAQSDDEVYVDDKFKKIDKGNRFMDRYFSIDRRMRSL